MDTKWKKRKTAVSAMCFVLGASLTLGGLAGILRDKPGRVHLWQAEELFRDDYQQEYRFQDYVTGRFWNFLTMAAGGDLERSWGYWNGYYDYTWDETSTIVEDEVIVEDRDWEIYQDNLEEMTDVYEEMMDTYEEMEKEWERLEEEGADAEAEAYRDEMEAYRDEMEAYQETLEEYRDEMETYQSYRKSAPTEEEKKEAIQKYHERIKGDKNLLYTISYEDKVLYANSELLKADGQMKAPEGYNFLLYFDGEKVKIVKDGKEVDVYGDGFYREESEWGKAGQDWYVPGYQNFPVEENLKKAKVFLAVAKDPVLYMAGSYGTSSMQYDNALYWMDQNCRTGRKILEMEAVCLLIGLVFLLLAFFGRKSGREAAERVAGVQAKIWLECKVFLLFGLFALVVFLVKSNGQMYGWWQEPAEVFYWENAWGSLTMYGREIVRNVSPLSWVVLFWGIWFVWNDVKYNKKIWTNSLVGKLRREFSTKSLDWSLARKMAYRNGLVFALAALYVLLFTGMIISWINDDGNAAVFLCLVFSGAVAFLLAAYLAGRKNMEMARDMEKVSDRIREIRDGNYEAAAGNFAGHDLQTVMAQLEDIRHGLERAVEEQMKSQKMKVELIANVSHDIKTPLTSIISYVQFLKQEEGLPEHIKDYVRILDEKSQRLKNMVQDVFAVSKAASGELPVRMEELDFGKLLRQTLADMEEQIGTSAVSFRVQIPGTPVMIRADGERMYRVFQNLFLNAIQYSLAGSRVYVTLEAEGTLAVASVKNASLMELDREKDFAGRFTRGDESRTDGGSGLGLSIAQSFTEACGGEFSWETDADLFVVKVAFRILG